MDEKTQAVFDMLVGSFGAGVIEYRFENELHKFRINAESTHWLYVDRDFVEDHAPQDILDRLARHKIVDEFKGSGKSRWLFVGEHGAKEVNDAFGRGHAL